MAAEALPPITRGSDPATASNWRTWRAAHYDWSATVDPFKRTLQGVVAVHVAPVAVGALADGEASTSARTHVVLDSHACLAVSRVDLHAADGGGDGESLEFETRDFTEFGTALRVALPAHAVAAGAAHSEAHASASEDVVGDVAFQLRITYAMKSAGPAVTWLSAAQTAGKELPYAYSIGQAVCNRGLLPCQDTPATRVTFSASLRVPAPLVALVATDETPGVEEDGRPTGVDVDGGDGEHPLREFRYRMTQSVPIYLLAIAVGDLSSARIGPRSRVWCEPSGLEAAQFEFGEGEIVERYVAAGEELFGEYRWKRYDVLVMPPAFAYGGMENPCLTFINTAVVCGDQSLGDVVAHEITHSWFGNLVTNASWSEFFLNEGFTMFGQRRILVKVHGAAHAALETVTGRALLEIAAESTPPLLQRLRVPMAPGLDPDDTYNEFPYEKGFAFVCWLRKTAGCSDDDFDRIFLRQYVEKHASTCVMSEDMLACYFECFPHLKRDDLEAELDAWLNGPGLPTFWPDCSAGDELKLPAEELLAKWLGGAADADAGAATWSALSTYPRLHFLDQLLSAGEADFTGGPATVLAALDAAYALSSSGNAEIRLRWSQIVAKHAFEPAFPSVVAFLQATGKQKYVIPVVEALWRSPGHAATRPVAKQIFDTAASGWQDNIKDRAARVMAAE